MKVEIRPAEPTKGTQTVVMPDLSIEELEEKIAPGSNLNHNQTFVSDEIDSGGD